MYHLLPLVFFAAVLGQYDPSCGPFSVQDPSSGAVYQYDIGRFKVSDTDTSLFVAGKEGYSAWTAYINVCGNAQAIGCTETTPVCQNDGALPPKYVSMGSTASWTLSPYFNTSQGPSAVIPDGGVVASISHGDVCETTGTGRETTLFLKCDPNVSVRPTTAVITEKNPYTGQQTTCHYWVGPIAHRDFCPVLAPVVPESAPVDTLFAKLFPNVTVTFEAVTTDATLLEQAGFQCSPFNSSCTNVFHCQGTAAESGTAKVPLLDLKLTYKDSTSTSTFSWSTTNGGGSATCPDDNGGYFKATGPNAAWVVGSSGITAAVGPKKILALSNAYAQSCFRCSSKKVKSFSKRS